MDQSLTEFFSQKKNIFSGVPQEWLQGLALKLGPSGGMSQNSLHSSIINSHIYGFRIDNMIMEEVQVVFMGYRAFANDIQLTFMTSH